MVLTAVEDAWTCEGTNNKLLAGEMAIGFPMTLVSTTYFSGSRSVVPNGQEDLAPSAR